jgi:hypothetical protein
VASYNERIDALHNELTADAAQRADSGARAVAVGARHAAELEAARGAAAAALAKLDVTRSQAAQLQQAAEVARGQAAAAEAAAEQTQQASSASAAQLQKELVAVRKELADTKVALLEAQDDAAAAQRTAAASRSDAVASHRSLQSHQASSREEDARLTGQLSEARAAQEHSARQCAALQQRLAQTRAELQDARGELLAIKEEDQQCYDGQYADYNAGGGGSMFTSPGRGTGSPSSAQQLSPARPSPSRRGGAAGHAHPPRGRHLALRTSSRALAELLAEREGDVAALAVELEAALRDIAAMADKVRLLEAAAAAGAAEQAPAAAATAGDSSERLAGEIVRLEKDRERLTARVQDLEQQLAAAAAAAAGAAPAAQGTSSEGELQQQVLDLTARFEAAEAAARESASEVRQLQQQLAGAREELELAKAAVEALQGRAESLKGQLADAELAAETYRGEADAARAAAERAMVESAESSQLLQRELGFLQSQFEEVVEEATRKDGELEAAKAALAAAVAAADHNLLQAVAAEAPGATVAAAAAPMEVAGASPEPPARAEKVDRLRGEVEAARAGKDSARSAVQELQERVAGLEQQAQQQLQLLNAQQQQQQQPHIAVDLQPRPPATGVDPALVQKLLQLQAGSGHQGGDKPDAAADPHQELRRALSQPAVTHVSPATLLRGSIGSGALLRGGSGSGAGGGDASGAAAPAPSKAKSLDLRSVGSNAWGEGNAIARRASGSGSGQDQPQQQPARQPSAGRETATAVSSRRSSSGNVLATDRRISGISSGGVGAAGWSRYVDDDEANGSADLPMQRRRPLIFISSSSSDDERGSPATAAAATAGGGAGIRREASSGLNRAASIGALTSARRSSSGSGGSFGGIGSGGAGGALFSLKDASSSLTTDPTSRPAGLSRAATAALGGGGYNADTLRKSLNLRSLPGASAGGAAAGYQRSRSLGGAARERLLPAAELTAAIMGRVGGSSDRRTSSSGGAGPIGGCVGRQSSSGSARGHQPVESSSPPARALPSRQPSAERSKAALMAAGAVRPPATLARGAPMSDQRAAVRQTVSFKEGDGGGGRERAAPPVRRSLTVAQARVMQRVRGLPSSSSDSDSDEL